MTKYQHLRLKIEQIFTFWDGPLHGAGMEYQTLRPRPNTKKQDISCQL